MTKPLRSLAAAAALAAGACLCGPAGAAFTDIFVFGDSLSDTGNVLSLNGGLVEVAPFTDAVPDRPYAFGGGRFSNGPVWVEFLAGDLGLSLAGSEAGGNGFAFGGARSGALPGVPDAAVPSVADQASAAINRDGALPGDALFVVWGGANDVREAAELAAPGTPAAIAEAEAAITAGVQNLAGAVTDLALAGAETILLANVPDVGLTPAALALGPVAAAGATQLAAAFNDGLAGAVPGLEGGLGIDILEFDTFALVNAVVADPAAFGFTDTTTACALANGGLGCSSPDEFLFWDGIHPTTAAHELIAEAAVAVIPLPPAAPLCLAGLLAIGAVARRRPAQNHGPD